MTIRDRREIKELFHFHRYSKAAIARVYGISRERVRIIIKETETTSFLDDGECALCENDIAKTYFIDGNEENHDPQNKIQLCEMDRRRVMHLKVTKRIKS